MAYGHEALDGGHFVIISGENPARTTKHTGHEALKHRLVAEGMADHMEEITGRYGGKDKRAFILYIRGDNGAEDEMTVARVAYEFGQESILHSHKGDHGFWYLDSKGILITHGGHGFRYLGTTPPPDGDNYSRIAPGGDWPDGLYFTLDVYVVV